MAVLNTVAREGLCGQMTFEQRFARSEGLRPAGWWRRASQAGGTANARPLRGDRARLLHQQEGGHCDGAQWALQGVEAELRGSGRQIS